DRLARENDAHRAARIDQDAATLRRDGERVPHLFEPLRREPLLLEHVQHRPAARLRRRLGEPLEVEIRQPALRAILLEAGRGPEEAVAERRRRTLDRLAVLALIHPPAVLEARSVALAAHERTVTERCRADKHRV